MKIIFKNIDNSIAIITPTQEALSLYDIKAIALKDVPHGLSFKIVDDSILPESREFRNAWTIDDAELTDGVGGELNTFSVDDIKMENNIKEALEGLEKLVQLTKIDYPIYSERIEYYKATYEPTLVTALLLKEEEELV